MLLMYMLNEYAQNSCNISERALTKAAVGEYIDCDDLVPKRRYTFCNHHAESMLTGVWNIIIRYRIIIALDQSQRSPSVLAG